MKQKKMCSTLNGWFCVSLMFVTGLSACAYKVPVLRIKAAKMDVAGVRKIGIMVTETLSSESNKNVREFASKIQEALQMKRFFSEVHLLGNGTLHKQMDAILDVHPQKMQVSVQSGIEKQIVEEETGKKIIENYTENGQQKTREVPEKIRKIYDVPYVEKETEISLTVDFIPSKKGNSSRSITLKNSTETRALGMEQIHSIPSDEVLLNSASNPLVTQLLGDLIPQIVAEKIKLATNPDCVRGLQKVKQGDWKGALESWQAVAASNPANHAAYYNIGVAFEALKNYSASILAYQKAVSLSDRKQYKKAVLRLKDVIKENERLKNQLEGRHL
ncbi:MAG: tetratricopeptide repeat protein [Deltaproteobacteria bacterium]|nr:tetratricopeptide repeat protein [Deltaproteobacteria bacterium]